MGMIEEARVNLARGKQGDDQAIQIAGVQASIAIAESLDGVQSLLEELIGQADKTA